MDDAVMDGSFWAAFPRQALAGVAVATVRTLRLGKSL